MRWLLPIFLTACSYGPAHLEQAKASVDKRMTFVSYYGWKRPAGMPYNQGNCAAFAKAYRAELKRKGYDGKVFGCILPDGEHHAALQVGEWVLDNRYPMVVPLEGYECKQIGRK